MIYLLCRYIENWVRGFVARQIVSLEMARIFVVGGELNLKCVCVSGCQNQLRNFVNHDRLISPATHTAIRCRSLEYSRTILNFQRVLHSFCLKTTFFAASQPEGYSKLSCYTQGSLSTRTEVTRLCLNQIYKTKFGYKTFPPRNDRNYLPTSG